MINMEFYFDIVVIGGGHAGCEAAHIAAKMGAKTALITMDMTKFGQMSCNPAMGGIAKGQIIREIDALGGMSGIVTDRSMIQFRILNRSKGPAMWSPRAQCDRQLFSREWRKVLERTDNLYLWQEPVIKILIENKSVKGIETISGTKFLSKAVIVTAGTFLNGLIHIGLNHYQGGRTGELPSIGLSDQLRAEGIEVGRLKTGTSARIDGRSIDFSKMIEQKGDGEGRCFSFMHNKYYIKGEKSCYITYTNEEVHEELEKGLKFSPLFTGIIKGRGPRYCPSIEDKIVTFKEKKSHQMFIEPEGWETCEYYINGFASSLPLEVQLKALRRMPGLENVEIYRPGYAIEYDFFPPTQLKHSLESKIINGLFMAGQVNGTTGYEEAAAQGIVAGINAVLKYKNQEPFIMTRDESYIGVLIDDLVIKGVDEPYRMFTSRAEYRILLRQDNADERLTKKGYEIGTVDEERIKRLNEKEEMVNEIIEFVKRESLEPERINEFLTEKGTSSLMQRTKVVNIALRPKIRLRDLLERIKKAKDLKVFKSERIDEIMECAEIKIKYEGYIKRERQIADKIKRLESLRIPADINYNELFSISTEGRQKLNRIRPETIGQASRISGVSPADINVLLMYLGR